MRCLSTAVLLIASIGFAPPLLANESTQTASNGIEISVNSDEFADRYEYAAPVIKFGSVETDNGVVLLARVKSSGTLTPVMVQGFIIYRDEWRRYSSALFRGGEKANFRDTGRNVISCRSKPCTLSEQFTIDLSPEQIEKYSTDGKLQIQLRSQNAQTFMIEVPEDYIKALLEITKGS